jgi:hypothetical protein
MAAFTGSGHHRRAKARWADVSYSITAAVANRPICITSFGSFGSSPTDRCALITTARHSKAASQGTKRDTGWSSPKSCRSRTGSLGPIPAESLKPPCCTAFNHIGNLADVAQASRDLADPARSIGAVIQKRSWDTIASVERLCPLLAKADVALHNGSVAIGYEQTLAVTRPSRSSSNETIDI